jgi:enoyl-CoA hydratase
MGTQPKNYESLAVDVDGNVAQVTLLGPGKGNAMGPAFWAELPVAFEALDTDPDVRAIVLAGSGKNFSYGLDLAAMGDSLGAMMSDGGLARPRADFHTRLRGMQQSITAVADCRTPVIASVHGWCIGGGVDLISAVDIRYASADAKFSVREVKLAIVADVGSLARLPLILSEGHLRELALTGRDIDAARAEKIGLVNDVYADADASLAAAHATAAEIAANPPLVVQGVKDVLDEQRTAQVSASLRYVAAWNSAFLPSKDLTEGISAMFAKRAPEFKGE